MKHLLKKTGWKIIKYQKRDFSLPIVDYFVCKPAQSYLILYKKKTLKMEFK